MSNSTSYLMIAIGFAFLFLLVTAVHSVEGKSDIEISASLYKDGYTTITVKGNIPYLYFNDILVAENIIDFYQFNYTIPEDKLPYEVNWAVYTQEKSQYTYPIKIDTILIKKITESSEKPALATKEAYYYQHMYAEWEIRNLKVYIQTENDTQRELITDALKIWQWYLKDAITFTLTEKFGEADMSIIIVRDLQSEYQCKYYHALGCTDPLINTQTRSIRHIDMHVGGSFYEQNYDEKTGITHKKMIKLDDKTFFITALHEIGHGIGLAHFPENYNNIMYPELKGQNMGVSKENVKVLLKAYGV